MLRDARDTTLYIRVLRDRPVSLQTRFNARASALSVTDVIATAMAFASRRKQNHGSRIYVCYIEASRNP